MRSYVVAAAPICGSFFSFLEKSNSNFIAGLIGQHMSLPNGEIYSMNKSLYLILPKLIQMGIGRNILNKKLLEEQSA